MIYTGTAETKNIYEGSTEVKKIYLGTSFIWENFDSDALHYIASVENELGYEITGFQKNAIDSFYKNEKENNRYHLIKRMYLPIWGNANANAICLVSGISGVWNGEILHEAGYVQGDGLTGYFDLGATSESLGLSPTSAGLIFLCRTTIGTATQAMGARLSIATDFKLASNSGGNLTSGIMNNRGGQGNLTSNTGNANNRGILITSKLGSIHINARRLASGYQLLDSVERGPFGSNPNFNIYALAKNVTGDPGSPTSSQAGAFLVILGISTVDAEALSFSLKTLWETCTGLTLP
jgi:hypothetical protein